ncbi:MAG: hypothetical protein ACYDH5_07860 [Acidimicrobiales bacterium]
MARGDWLVVGSFCLVALAVFLVPALAGHPLMVADDVIQNYPLRTLVGADLASGHLPAWDPYIWSGSPLLAGFNAGAAFPLTWLFAVLPSYVAWAVTEVVVYCAAMTGTYLFLRDHGLSSVACSLGALTFSVGGYMSSQMVHIDLVEGASIIPFALLCLRRMAGGPAVLRWRWTGALALCLGLMVLSGSPEAAILGSIGIMIYTVYLVVTVRPASVGIAVMAGAAVAASVGVAIGAAQIVPGISYAQASQRGHPSFQFFTAGSVPPELFVLLLVPYILGGFGRFGLPEYFGQYNLPELGAYVGMLPLAAIASLPSMMARGSGRARATGRLTGRRARGAGGSVGAAGGGVGGAAAGLRPGSGWGIWYLIGAIGTVLALGSYTPVSHLMFHVPAYDLLRLPSRNMLWLDLSAAVLLAFWVDRCLLEPSNKPSRVFYVLAAAPAVAVVGVAALFFGLGRSFEVPLAHIGGAARPTIPSGLASHVGPFVAVSVLLALAAVALAVVPRRLGLARRRTALFAVALVVADLLAFNVSQSWLVSPAAGVLSDSTVSASRVAQLAGGGRFAIYDPHQDYPGQLVLAGQADLNVLRRGPSVQGYGSLVSGTYQKATGAHLQTRLDVAALAGDTFDLLDMTNLVALKRSFIIPVGGPWPAGARSAPGRLRPDGSRSWFFGTTLSVSSVVVSMPGYPAAGPAAGSLRLGLILPSGVTQWPAVPGRSAAGMVAFSLPSPAGAVGVYLSNASRSVLPIGEVGIQAGAGAGQRYVLAGSLSKYVRAPHYRYAGRVGAFSDFVNTRARGMAWAVPLRARPRRHGTGANSHAAAAGHGATAAGAGARPLVQAGPTRPWGAQTVVVRSPVPVLLVRSESYASGWTAAATPLGGGKVLTQPVSRDGLLQSVRLPRGAYSVRFSYRSASIKSGMLVSSGGLVAAAGLVLSPVTSEARGRRGRRWRERAARRR